MKVLNLACSAGHDFEGWFGSEDDFATQQAGGLLECPVCGSPDVHKRLSAPRLNLAPKKSHAQALQALRELVDTAEDVGDRFAHEARKIHRGEAPVRGIRGKASMDEALSLVEEGVPVLPLPDMPQTPDKLH